MAIGLGFANPELKRAQMLAQLNGSTRLPVNPGSGPPPVSPDIQGGPNAAPAQMPAPAPADFAAAAAQGAGQTINPAAQASVAPAAPPEDPLAGHGAKVPKWAKIAGAIGHVLLSIDAGYNGRGMPSAPDYLDASKEQDQEMQVAEFLFNTTARAYEVSRKAPPGLREPMMAQFKRAVNQVAPDFDFDGFMESLQSDPERLDNLAPDLATLSEDAKRMVMAQIRARGGNAQAASAVIKDEAFMAGVMGFEDERNAPSLKMKLQGIKGAMKKLGLPDDMLADATPEGFRQFNESLPERHRLSPSEMGTLRRQPALQRMIGMGRPPEEMGQDPTLESRAGRQPRPAALRPAAPAEDDGGDEDYEEPVASAPPRRRAELPPPKPSARTVAPTSQPRPQPQAKPRPRPAPESSGNAFLDEMVRRGDEGQRELQRRGVKAEEFVPRARAAQDEMEAYLEETGANRYPIEEAMQGRPPGAEPPPQRQARKPERAPQQAPAQRFKVPKDTTLPGVGPVKAGDTVIYDPKTKRYRRG